MPLYLVQYGVYFLLIDDTICDYLELFGEGYEKLGSMCPNLYFFVFDYDKIVNVDEESYFISLFMEVGTWCLVQIVRSILLTPVHDSAQEQSELSVVLTDIPPMDVLNNVPQLLVLRQFLHAFTN